MVFGGRIGTIVTALATALAAPVVDASAQSGRRVEGDFLNEHGSRHYVVYVPANRAPRSALVVVLHGCLQDPSDIARGTRFDERADTMGFLVLYPEQPELINPARCWRWFAAEHQLRGTGEPALLAALTRTVAQEFGADTARIFITGISAGGAMALNTIAAYPELFAAAAVHSALPYRSATSPMQAYMVMRGGQPDDSLRPERILDAPAPTGRFAPRPLFILHGAKDPIVIRRNGDQLARQWRLALEQALGRKLEEVARDTIVNGRPIQRVLLRDDRRVWIDHWTDLELGHAWSGGSKAGTNTDTAGASATDLITDFFDLARRR
jgi:poly(hydroxyalkanoate) depolymerase family esterase